MMVRRSAVVALAAVMLWGPVDGAAQGSLRNPLKGLTVIAPTVIVSWDDGIEGKTEAQYKREVRSAFELGLLRMRIRLDQNVRGVLNCRLILLRSSNGRLVAYAMNVLYSESVVVNGTATQRAITWSGRAVGMVGLDNFSGTEAGEWCAETFELDWLRANN